MNLQSKIDFPSKLRNVFERDHLALNFARAMVTPLTIILCCYITSHFAHKDGYLLFFAVLFPLISKNKGFLM